MLRPRLCRGSRSCIRAGDAPCAGANTGRSRGDPSVLHGRSRVSHPSFPSLGLGHCQLRVSLGGSSLTGAQGRPPRFKGHSGRGEGFLPLLRRRSSLTLILSEGSCRASVSDPLLPVCLASALQCVPEPSTGSLGLAPDHPLRVRTGNKTRPPRLLR